jgi:hypothetical protein
MTTFRLLCVGAVALVLVGCSGAGSEPVLQNGDAAYPGDAAGDSTVTGDAVMDDSGVKDVVAGELAPGCDAACTGKVCGEFDGCVCGTCLMQSYCSQDGTMCLGDADIGDPCNMACQDVDCGVVQGCECGDCSDGFQCAENQCVEICVPQCVEPETGNEFQCGDDGCGGNCGECDIDEWCEQHMCLHDDPPDCEAACADGGFDCGAILEGMCECGACDGDSECLDNVCTAIPPDCDVVCDGLECGDVDGCDCGTCQGNLSCTAEFVCECIPACANKECGDDGCGGHCGECEYGSCQAGECVCTTNCAGKSCGSDGCGGVCGSCAGGEICSWLGDCLSSCTPNTVSFSDTVQKLNVMQMGSDGMDGQALDVDGNPNTCSPFGKCENGNDNALANLFSSIESFVDVNAQLEGAVNNGAIVMVAELVGYVTNGLPFSLNMYIADPVSPKNQCNFQTSKCNYLVDGGAIDWTNCVPLVTFDNASVVNNVLTAGGNGYKFDLLLPFFSGQPMLLTLKNARIKANVVSTNGGFTLSQGVIGGAMDKQILVDAVDELPDNSLPVSKDMVKSLINMLINNDIDTTGDGKKDSASMGIKFTTIPGAIVGVQ